MIRRHDAGARRHRPALPVRAAGALVVLAALSACEKPSPVTTVQSRTLSISSEAVCWAREGTIPADSPDCVPAPGEAAVLPVRANEPVAIDVDIPVADYGWVPYVGDVPMSPEPLKGTHHRFEVPLEQLRHDPRLRIVARESMEGPIRGVWAYDLTWEQRQ